MRFLLVLFLAMISGCNSPDSIANLDNSYMDDYAQPDPSGRGLVEPQKPVHVSQSETDDGPPAKPHFKEQKPITPVSEAISRYGNPTEYAVNGKRYEVLKSAYGYREQGLASWYGTKFHKKRTSSGETYDLYGMTAAHKTLPLPTYVKVRNLNNGQEVVVKVNDRGPFHKDRIIDLSYAAAKKLGLLKKGTAPVELEALAPDGIKNKPANFYLQVGAFSEHSRAKKLLQKLSGLTSTPSLIESYNKMYVVKVGPFSEREQTEDFKKVLAQHGISDAFSMMQ